MNLVQALFDAVNSPEARKVAEGGRAPGQGASTSGGPSHLNLAAGVRNAYAVLSVHDLRLPSGQAR